MACPLSDLSSHMPTHTCSLFARTHSPTDVGYVKGCSQLCHTQIRLGLFLFADPHLLSSILLNLIHHTHSTFLLCTFDSHSLNPSLLLHPYSFLLLLIDNGFVSRTKGRLWETCPCSFSFLNPTLSFWPLSVCAFLCLVPGTMCASMEDSFTPELPFLHLAWSLTCTLRSCLAWPPLWPKTRPPQHTMSND